MLYYLQALILGAVQGVTEFLPISSTAHLIIFEKIFHLDPKAYGLSFDMFINLGTVVAALIYFWKDLRSIFGSLRLKPLGSKYTQAELLPWRMIVVTLILAVIGFIFEKQISADLRSLPVIAGSLVVVAFLMMAAEKKLAENKKPSLQLDSTRTYLIGLSQALAFIPGVSRSGITISTGLFSGLNRVTAARYSFLLSVPITLAAIVKRLLTFESLIAKQGISHQILLFYTLGAISSGLVGFFSLKFLINYLNRHSLFPFAVYRLGLAFVIIVFSLLNKFL